MSTPTTPRVRLGSSDIEVYPLNLGGNVFGWSADEQQSFDVLDAYSAAGGNFVDTADVYSVWGDGNTGGESETVIGHWLAERDVTDLVVATKVGMLPPNKGLSAEKVDRGVDASLTRLGVSSIDLYYAHADDTDVAIQDIARLFSSLVDSGRIRTIGASNFSDERLQSWLDTAAAEGLHAPVAYQPKYNLVSREIEATTLPLTRAAGIAVLPYSSLAGGFLSGKYRDGSAPVDSLRAAGASKLLDDRGRATLTALDEIAAAHNVEVATVALSWLRQQDGVTAPIASARTVEQLPALLASVTLDLSTDELIRLSAASA